MKSTLIIILLATATCGSNGQGSEVGALDSMATALELVAEEIEEPEPIPTDDRQAVATWTTSAAFALERRAGYAATDSTAFAGPPIAFRSRLRARLGNHGAIVLVADHDAGEGFGSLRRTFDFVGASVGFSNVGPIRMAVIGALRPRIGLGLSMWGGRRMTRLASGSSSFLRPSASVRASGSIQETSVLQGVGLDLSLSSWVRLTGFIARTTSDARIAFGQIASLSTTGLHRSDRELDADDRLVGRLIGGAVLVGTKTLSVGASLGTGSTNLPIPDGDRPFQRHRFSGDRWRGGSVFGSGVFRRKVNLAAEVAWDDDGTRAALIVARLKTARGFDLTLSWRDYPATFNSVYGSAPGAGGSVTGNEMGLTVGLSLRVLSRQIAIFRDLYRKPWLQFDSNRPSNYSAWGFRADGHLGGMRIMLRHDSRVTNQQTRSNSPAAAPFSRRERLRARLEVETDRGLRPSFDLVLVRLHEDRTETGHGVGQRLVWEAGKTITLTAGVVFFDTDSGRSRVYLYEPDLPDYLSIPSLSNSGLRGYLILDVAISRSMTVWFKVAVTRFDEERTIGSGIDELTASQLRTLSMAIRARI